MNPAETPFEFFTVAYLTRIGNQSAGNLEELLAGLERFRGIGSWRHGDLGVRDQTCQARLELYEDSRRAARHWPR